MCASLVATLVVVLELPHESETPDVDGADAIGALDAYLGSCKPIIDLYINRFGAGADYMLAMSIYFLCVCPFETLLCPVGVTKTRRDARHAHVK